jgi:hypothetical protein
MKTTKPSHGPDGWQDDAFEHEPAEVIERRRAREKRRLHGRSRDAEKDDASRSYRRRKIDIRRAEAVEWEDEEEDDDSFERVELLDDLEPLDSHPDDEAEKDARENEIDDR